MGRGKKETRQARGDGANCRRSRLPGLARARPRAQEARTRNVPVDITMRRRHAQSGPVLQTRVRHASADRARACPSNSFNLGARPFSAPPPPREARAQRRRAAKCCGGPGRREKERIRVRGSPCGTSEGRPRCIFAHFRAASSIRGHCRLYPFFASDRCWSSPNGSAFSNSTGRVRAAPLLRVCASSASASVDRPPATAAGPLLPAGT